jgi:WD40 repeat protein
LYQIQQHKKEVTGIAIDITASHILHTISADKSVFTYDLNKSEVAKVAKRITYHIDEKGNGMLALTQRRDRERELIVSTADGRLLFYDIDYPQPVLTLTPPINHCKIHTIAVSPSGAYLACGTSTGILLIYDLRFDTPLIAGQFAYHSGEVLTLAWSPDERQLVSAGTDCGICVWNFYGASLDSLQV